MVADNLALAARLAACEEAEATHDALEAKLSVMRDALASTAARLEEQEATAESMLHRSDELAAREVEAAHSITMITEGLEACEERTALTKHLLHESGRKLEALRARGGVAE